MLARSLLIVLLLHRRCAVLPGERKQLASQQQSLEAQQAEAARKMAAAEAAAADVESRRQALMQQAADLAASQRRLDEQQERLASEQQQLQVRGGPGACTGCCAHVHALCFAAVLLVRHLTLEPSRDVLCVLPLLQELRASLDTRARDLASSKTAADADRRFQEREAQRLVRNRHGSAAALLAPAPAPAPALAQQQHPPHGGLGFPATCDRLHPALTQASLPRAARYCARAAEHAGVCAARARGCS